MSAIDKKPPEPVAIIGIGCMFPKAENLARYWSNIKHGVDAITDLPETHWRPEDYFDPDPKAPDRVYAKRGGFLTPVDFHPLDFGIAPNDIEATDTTQLLGLLVAREALADAGYGANGKAFDRNRVSVILGVTGTLELVIPLGARLGHPIWRRALKAAGVADPVANDVVERISESYVGWQENSFPGLLGNVAAGRIANRLDLSGTNCVVDAACASSLGAIHLAMLELWAGRSDMVLTGGLDTFNDIFMYTCFSKTPALSPTGSAKPFDMTGDGTTLGEGLGVVALKRLADAERDGDRIYAVVRSMGSSSDGKGPAIYAPSPAGQVKALRQAYELAGITPDTIELVEAHGTGTRAGDAAEVAALTEVYRAAKPEGTWCALGSVKSQIGHTKAAAGAAGFIKAALALQHKVLPPTIKVNQPILSLGAGSKTDGAIASPLYVNTERRPWLPGADHPRRAAVSAFGFGGSNFHCVLEEYRAEKQQIDWDGSVEILAFSAETPEKLLEQFTVRSSQFAERTSNWSELQVVAAGTRAAFRSGQPCRLIFVVEKDKADLSQRLKNTQAKLEKNPRQGFWSTLEGAYFGSGPRSGKLAMIFPGQGSQYVGMLRDLACQFPAFLEALAEANATFDGQLSNLIYPFPAFSDVERARNEDVLRCTEVAQPAIAAVSLGALRVLHHFGIRPEAVGGHSFGELTALCAAGCFDAVTFFKLARQRGQLMAAGAGDRGAMLAVLAPLADVEHVLTAERLELIIANKNSPRQLVLSGPTTVVDRAAEVFEQRRMPCRRLPVSAAFHSPLVADAQQPFLQALEPVAFAPATIPVFANTTAREYPRNPQEARRLLAEQLTKPVEFIDEVMNMYEGGVRTFLEVGPTARLTALVADILKGREHQALALDASSGKRSGILDLARTLAHLSALGYPVDLSRWEDGIHSNSASVAPKQSLTVRLCGANYVKPKPPRQPVAGLSEAGHKVEFPQDTSMNRTRTSTPSTSPDAGAISEPGLPQKPKTEAPLLRGLTPPGSPVPADASLLAQAFRATQENLLALQKLSEQTAELHRQFLTGQERAQQTFQQLLEQQRRLVEASLGTTETPVRGSAAATSIPRTSVSVPAALPPASSAAAEVPAAPVPVAPITLPAVEPKPQVASNGHVTAVLLTVVAEKTGYPTEMLDLDMALDSDLGIDSIKRVEILSALQEKLPDAPVVKPEHLGTLRTLRQIVAFLNTGPAVGTLVSGESQEQKSPLTTHHSLLSNEHVTSVLLTVVSEKTGYPTEMLDLDMALDSDLGIDSIKRVEILSALQEQLPEAPTIKPEHLGTLRTLRQIVEFTGAPVPAGCDGLPATAKLESIPGMVEAGNPCHPMPSPATTNGEAKTSPGLHRYIPVAAELDEAVAREHVSLAAKGEIWVTDDGSELASLVAERLRLLGHSARVISPADIITKHGPDLLAGLVILAPRGRTDDRFLLDAFKLLQFAASGLRRAGKSGGAVLVTMSRLDGAFGLRHLTPSADLLSGGLAGLAKTAAHEWPEVRCKALDLAADFADLDEAALAIVDEILLAGPVEVGIATDGRCALQLKLAPLGSGNQPGLVKDDVIVITGGARGVTAEVAVALARAFGPTLILLGRSPEPGLEEGWLASLHNETEIKKALAARANGQATPKQVGEQYQQLMANREIRRNLERIKAAGAKVLYRSVDVRDAQTVRAVIDDVGAQFGRITGLVHGAGVLADSRIEDKTEEQFERVYSTKVAGLQNLLQALDRDELRLVVLFSSSTGRFGRAGQADYALANEVLNKLAQREARKRPSCRVLSVNWGPWDGGMVTPALKKLFAAEGMDVIPLDAGAEYLVQEIGATDRPVEVVVLAGALPEFAVRSSQFTAERTATSANCELRTVNSTLSLAFEREIDVAGFPILTSHVIDGHAVLPVALSIEWLAHAAMHHHPGLVFHGFDELRVLKGLILEEDKPATVRALAGKGVKEGPFFVVPAELRGSKSDGREVVYTRANILLAATLPSDEPRLKKMSGGPYPRGRAEIYDGLLFHGPELQGIQEVEGCSEEGVIAVVRTGPEPARWLKKPLRNTWLADPLALDSSFQMMVLWSFEKHGIVSLPCFAGRYRQYRRAFPRDSVRVVIQVTKDLGHRALADIEFLDAAGALIARMEDYECVIDASLNQAFRRNQLAEVALPTV